MSRGIGRVPRAEVGRTVLVYEHVSGGGLAGRDLPASWAREGSAIRRSLAGDFASLPGVRVVMPLDARLDDEPGPWSVVRIGPGEADETIGRLALASDLTIPIAPETGGVLRDLATLVARVGGTSIGASPRAIDLAGDKLRLAGHLARLGIPTTPTRLVRPRDGLPVDAPYPAVLKPVDGAGAVDTLLVAGHDDPIAATFGDQAGLLQPYIAGAAWSVSYLARDGAILRLGVARQRIGLDRGRFSYLGGTIVDEPPPLDGPTRHALGSIPGLDGFVGVDLLVDEATGRATLLEINPRPTTSCVGLVAALGPGRLASAWLADPADWPSIEATIARTRSRRPVRFSADGSIEATTAGVGR